MLTVYQNGLSIEVEGYGQTMALKFIDLNSAPVVEISCGNRKLIGKEKENNKT